MSERVTQEPVAEGTLLWQPSEQRRASSAMAAFQHWVTDNRGIDVGEPERLWRWSTEDLDGFWSAIWDFFDVQGDGDPRPALAEAAMPGARWFPGVRVSYAEHALARTGEAVAVVARREDGHRQTLTHDELRAAVGAAAAGLRRLGVSKGDRVAAVLPNGLHALITFLATASLGAVWSSCSPDFGARSLVDRFSQIEPTVLLGVDGYRYAGKAHSTLETLANLQARLPSLRGTVVVGYLRNRPSLDGLRQVISWQELTAEPADPQPVRVPFDHPLWILYSSGTTGLPKPIVQGHGGILVEHLKSLSLQSDLGPEDCFFWFTTTGWMMWNFLIGGLLVGARIVLYDGSPGFPDLAGLWRLAASEGVTYFGTSAPYLMSCRGAGIRPRDVADTSRIASLGSTGAPLTAEGFRWVYEAVGADLLLASVSGGTDVCTAFVGSSPLLPVYAGEIQTRALGCAVATFDQQGREVTGEVGELVVTKPMPSMPLCFWGDADGSRLRESYFADFPGVWRHGDWAKITRRGTVVIYGRSDSTLNRGGVRIGTAEFYRAVNDLPEVVDSLVIDTTALGTDSGRLLLFVALEEGTALDEDLRGRIRATLRDQFSPRHVPDLVEQVPDVPRTLNGKKLEVPVKRLIAGAPLEKAVSVGAVANPEVLQWFVDFAGGQG